MRLMKNEMLSRRMGQVHHNPIRALLNAGVGDAIPFIAGYPAIEAYEMDVLRDVTNEAIDRFGHQCFAYSVTGGLDSLKQSIVDHYLSYKGMGEASTENMIIVTGSTQCFDMAGKVLLTPGDTVLMEDPSFVGTMAAFSMFEPNIVGVKADDIGMDLEDLEAKIIQHHPKLIYVVPTFGNPSGKTLPPERRKKIAELAAKYNVYVMEDDPYGDIRFYGERLKPIKAYDEGDRVIYVQSFSKIFVPGLRLAFAMVPKDLYKEMIFAKQTTDMHTTILSQYIAQVYLDKDLLWPNIQRLSNFYKKRWDVCKKNMDLYFPKNVKYVDTQGGYFTWLTLPEGIDAEVLFHQCLKEENIAFIPGYCFYVNMDQKNNIRLSFSACTEEQIADGIKRMGEFLKRHIPE